MDTPNRIYIQDETSLYTVLMALGNVWTQLFTLNLREKYKGRLDTETLVLTLF